VARRTVRSISVPITFGAVTVPLSALLLVGWTVFVARRITDDGQVVENVWLLVLGVISFVVIMSVLVMFTIFLAREILEVRKQDSFIDSVTHELKSPLASIKLCMQTLEREGLPEDKREKLRSMMRQDVDRLTSFIDDVLQASRLAHDDSVGMDLEDVPLAALARHCAETVAARQKLAPGAITIAVPENLTAHTDRAAMEIVLRNLIDNAVKYSREPVQVTVRARDDVRARRTILEVEDTGIGIPKDDLKRVFARFYRAPSEGVRKRKGTGLGLFVVSALVRNLGGSVEALSPGTDQGSTFVVRLPIHHPATLAEQAEVRAG
jgi:signal transduction histidine kinase